MTKEQFYLERDNKVKSEFESLKINNTVRESIKMVAKQNGLSYSVVDTIIYPRTYRMKNKISDQKST